ncbi:ABC transporter substrate binding protein [Arenibaculum pallidiluteum]|uniref:ABC transporter substrate binding protein n=1 Tax=Arenibaculum pallidiluteum TaxID=2812559 RepID=UPI001A958480|nr:ABC transporter substrate binding protein [Arenibaculum pallidiluteum]
MRRLVLHLLAGLLLGPLAASIGAADPAHEAASPDRGIVYLITWRGCEQACQGFLDHLADKGLPAEVVMRDAAQDRQAIPAFVDEARRLKAKAIVTWNSEVTLEVVGPHDAVDPARHVTDIPVVYMYVSGAVDLKISRHEDRTGRPNVAGTDYAVPLSAQAHAMTSYRPYRRMGMLYDAGQLGSVQRKDAMAALAKELNFELVAVPLPQGRDGRPDPGRLDEAMDTLAAGGVDCIYFGLSTFLVEQVKPFTRMAVERHLPVFSGGPLPVTQADALFAFFTRLEMIGALAAVQVEKILNEPGRPLDTLPIARFSTYSLVVNMDVALALELYPPTGMVRVADFVKDGKWIRK